MKTTKRNAPSVAKNSAKSILENILVIHTGVVILDYLTSSVIYASSVIQNYGGWNDALLNFPEWLKNLKGCEDLKWGYSTFQNKMFLSLLVLFLTHNSKAFKS